MLHFLLALGIERLLANTSNLSGDAQAAGCQGHLLAVWREGSGIAGAVDGKKIALSSASRGTPAVACGGISWLVVWPSDDFGVDGRRVAFDGTLLAPMAVFRGPFGADQVAAAYGDDKFLVAWTDGVTTRALRMNDAGTVLDSPALRANIEGRFTGPRIAWTGSAFFVTWAEDRANPLAPQPNRFWATRVFPGGTIEQVSLPILDGTSAGIRSLQLSPTANGDLLTLAWVAEHGDETCVDVAQVNAERRLLVAPQRVRCSDDFSGPVLDEAEVRWNRGESVLVWRELKKDFTSILRVMRLDEHATPKDDAPFTLLAQRARGASLTAVSEGVAAIYFAALPPPNEVMVAVFERVIEQEKPPGRRRAVRP